MASVKFAQMQATTIMLKGDAGPLQITAGLLSKIEHFREELRWAVPKLRQKFIVGCFQREMPVNV